MGAVRRTAAAVALRSRPAVSRPRSTRARTRRTPRASAPSSVRPGCPSRTARLPSGRSRRLGQARQSPAPARGSSARAIDAGAEQHVKTSELRRRASEIARAGQSRPATVFVPALDAPAGLAGDERLQAHALRLKRVGLALLVCGDWRVGRHRTASSVAGSVAPIARDAWALMAAPWSGAVRDHIPERISSRRAAGRGGRRASRRAARPARQPADLLRVLIGRVRPVSNPSGRSSALAGADAGHSTAVSCTSPDGVAGAPRRLGAAERSSPEKTVPAPAAAPGSAGRLGPRRRRPRAPSPCWPGSRRLWRAARRRRRARRPRSAHASARDDEQH